MKPYVLKIDSPGADTCVCVGRIGEAHVADLRQFRHVLWFVDAGGATGIPAGLEQASTVLETNLLEEVAAHEVEPLLERLLGQNLWQMPAVRVTADGLEHCPAAYQGVIDRIRAGIDSTRRARASRQSDGALLQKHLLLNFAAYATRRIPAAWAGALQGWPAIVCGPGASLETSCDALAGVADRAMIVAADSALHALARRGVAADFAVSIDAHSAPADLLPTDAPPARLVLASVSPPEWRAAVPADRCVCASSHEVTEDWLETMGLGRAPVVASEDGGSTARDLARFLGCSPVYPVGFEGPESPAGLDFRGLSGAEPFGRGRAGGSKRMALAHLPAVVPGDGPAIATACANLGSLGLFGCRAIGSVRRDLEAQDLQAAVGQLRTLFSNREFARAMGAFSLKIMPHLLAPESLADGRLATLLDELEELCCLAGSAYEAPVR